MRLEIQGHDGKPHIVEFETMPSDADIDYVASTFKPSIARPPAMQGKLLEGYAPSPLGTELAREKGLPMNAPAQGFIERTFNALKSQPAPQPQGTSLFTPQPRRRAQVAFEPDALKRREAMVQANERLGKANKATNQRQTEEYQAMSRANAERIRGVDRGSDKALYETVNQGLPLTKHVPTDGADSIVRAKLEEKRATVESGMRELVDNLLIEAATGGAGKLIGLAGKGLKAADAAGKAAGVAKGAAEAVPAPKVKPGPAGTATPTYKPVKKPPPKEPITSTTKAGAGTKNPGPSSLGKKVYHASPHEFDDLKDSPLYFFGEKADDVAKYGERGTVYGRKRQEPLVVDEDGSAYAHDPGSDTWKHVGSYDTGRVVPGSGKKPLTRAQAQRITDPNNDIGQAVSPSAYTYEASAGKVLELDKEGLGVFGALDNKGNAYAAEIVNKAKKGRFDWQDTRLVSQESALTGKEQADAWRILAQQLKTKGYEGIRFADDGHPTIALFDKPQLTSRTNVRTGERVDLAPSTSGKSAPVTQAKEPWEMARKEYAAFIKAQRANGENPLSITYHRNYVGKALNEGKAVPAHVVADYPEFAAKAPSIDQVEAFREAAKPVSGGIKGKRRGTASAGIAEDMILGIADAAKSAWSETSTRGIISGIRKVGAAAMGNTFDKLRAAGPAGVEMAKDLSRILEQSESMTASLGLRLKESVKTQYGKFYTLSREGRRALGGVARKVQNREKLTVREQQIWNTWTRINAELIEQGQKVGVLVEHVVGEKPNPKLLGEKVRFYTPAGEVEGIVKAVEEGQVILDVAGTERILSKWERFWARQLVEPDEFFPRELKAGILEKLQDEGTSDYKTLVDHLLKTKQAKDAATAKKAIDTIFDQLLAVTPTAMPARLERPRLGIRLPDEFYNQDFLDVAERHISRAAMRIAQAKVWGKNGEKLSLLLQKTPQYAQALAEDIRRAIGTPQARGPGTGTLRKIVSAEGTYTAISKLTGGTTGIVQITQGASSFGVFGGQALARSVMTAARDLVSGRRIIHEIKLSGAVDQEILQLMQVDDASKIGRWIADKGLALTGIKATDAAFRYNAALMGRIAVQHAIKKLKIRGGRIVQNADYRMLSDWFKYKDQDIIEMASTGKLTEAQKLTAYHGGVGTQVRARPVDIPTWIASNPWGKVLFRLNSFSYGQARIMGWTVKEATKGNFTPLMRMAAGYAVAGATVEELKEQIVARIEGRKAKPLFKDLTSAIDKAMKGDYDDLAGYLFRSTIKGGMMGMFGWPAEALLSSQQYAGNNSMAGRFLREKFQPKIASTVGSAVEAASAKRGKKIDTFLKKEVPLYKRLQKR